MLIHKGTQEIITDRLLLRKFREKDAKDMFDNWANDEIVTEYLSWPTHENIETTKKVLKSWIDNYDNNDNYLWAITLKDKDQVLGSIGVNEISGEHEYCTIGYCIGREFWGKGITTEAFKGIINYLFNEVKFERIQAYYHTNNPASGRVMAKSGLKYEGRLRHYRKNTKGEFVDCDFYGIIKEDFIKGDE